MSRLAGCGSSPASSKGHRIDAPKGTTTRPTSDFVREAAFNLIGPVDGAAVLDLFAGSGALGLEALSRGAARASSSSPTATPAARSTRTSRSCGLRRARALPGRRARARRRARHLRPRALRPALRLRRRTTPGARTSPASSRPTACSSTRPRARDRAGARRPRGPHLPQVRVRTPYPVRAVITAICPGSYDPVTNGHVDVITRAAAIFDRVVVGVVGKPQHKTTMFTIDERVEFLREALADVAERRGRRLQASSSSTSPAAGRRR